MKCVYFLGNRSPIKEAELCAHERDFVDQEKERRQEEVKKPSLDHGTPRPADMVGITHSLSVVNATQVPPLSALFTAL